MNIQDFIVNLTEAPMNPSSYASALKQGSSDGVKIGYEFEIILPKKFDKHVSIVDYENQVILNAIKNDWSNFMEFVGISKEKATLLSRLLKIKPEANPKLSDFKKAYKQHQTMNDDDWPNIWDLVQLIFPEDTERLMRNNAKKFRENFSEYFEITNFKKFKELVEYDYEFETIPEVEGDYSGKYLTRATALSEILKTSFNTEVEVFTEYHQATKSLKKWYIEPDGSLDPDDNDTALEVVSPPMPLEQAVEALKTFYQVSKTYGFKTGKEYSTGLHINVSIPKQLDLVKLVMFLGDDYLLKLFDRVDYEYAVSAVQELNTGMEKQNNLLNLKKYKKLSKVYTSIPKQKTAGFDVKKLKAIADYATSDHYSSISNSGDYISFRHAGGDYLNDYVNVLNVVGRFVQAMIIASDPAAYKNEYLKKLTKMIGTTNSVPVASINKTLRNYVNSYQYIKTNGYPVLKAKIIGSVGKYDIKGGIEEKLGKLGDAFSYRPYSETYPVDKSQKASQNAIKVLKSYLQQNKTTLDKKTKEKVKNLLTRPGASIMSIVLPYQYIFNFISELNTVTFPQVHLSIDSPYSPGAVIFELEHFPVTNRTVSTEFKYFKLDYERAILPLKNKLDEAEQPPIFYFAYGMLTDPDYMPGAELLGVGELRNFEFNLYNYANVEPKTGSRVQGALWKIDRNLLSALDQIEAYPELYDRRTYPVYMDGKKYPAEVYLMTPETLKYVRRTFPNQIYINTMLKGYQNAGIPTAQIYDAFYKEDLTESLKQAYSFRKETHGSYIFYYFKTDKDISYKVEYDLFYEDDHLSAWMEFSKLGGLGRYRISGTGDQFRIFATIIETLKDFIKMYDPNELSFSAYHDEPSRVKLYHTFANRVGSLFTEYEKSTKEYPKYRKTIYSFVKKTPGQLSESLKQAYPYKKIQDQYGGNVYAFETDDGNYYKVELSGKNYVGVSFYMMDKYGYYRVLRTGAGDAFRVFATVIEIVKNFISEHNPKSISFTADPSEPSRHKLYDTMTKKLAKDNPEYDLRISQSGSYTSRIYELVKTG